jgi:hypothetical protein
MDTLTESPRGTKTRHKNKRSSFHSHDPATTDSSSYVCDLTVDSDPEVPNESKMLVDLSGDSESDRSPLEYKNDNTETREVETDVDMSWETKRQGCSSATRGREYPLRYLHEDDTVTKMSPCSETRPGSTSLGLHHHQDVPRTRRSTYLER